jgi:exopolysaccharide production protein ExoQ
MNGRLPLWSALIEAVSARPFLGSGYQGFWRSEEFFELMDRAGWMTESAHNAFLDTMLSVGLIGGALHILVVIVGIHLVRRHFMQTADGGYGFVLAVLVFATVHSLTESTFAKPLFPAMIFVTGLSMLAFQRRCDSHGVDPPTWVRRSRPVQSIA